MADADGNELHRRPRFDHLDHFAQMLFEIAAMIDRQRRIVDRRAVGDHHQDTAILGARDQAVVRPEQRFAVDIFLEQPFTHHQPEVALGVAPRLVGLFVDDVAQVIEPPGHCGPPRRQPILTRLSAFPGARSEAQNLGFNAATFEGAGQDVGADRGNRNRSSTHRPAIVDQQRHYSIAEIGFAFDLVAERTARRHHNPSQPRGVEHPLFLVESPTAVLLRHQAALQAVGEFGDDRLQARQLLIKIGAQAVQFVFVGKFGRGDRLVIFGRPDLVIALRQMVPIAALRGDRLHTVVAHLAVGTVLVIHVLLVVICLGLFAFTVLRFAARFGLAGFALTFIIAFAVLFLFVVGIFTTLIGIRWIDIAIGQVQMLQHRLGQRGKGRLVIERHSQSVQIAARFVFDPATQHIDAFCRNIGDRDACEPFAHDQGKRGRNRHLVRRLCPADGVGAQFEVERMAEISGNTRHIA